MRLLVLLILTLVTLTLAACGGQSHEHTFVSDWSCDDASHWHAADCGHTEEVADKSAHTFTSQVTKEPTCTEEGLQTLTCSVCGDTREQVLPASHALEQVEAKEATCKEAGWDAYKRCTRCDYTTFAEKTVPHTFEKGVCVGCQIDYDTSWYDHDPEAASFVLDSPEDFVGLWRLVNGGTDSFKDKWIYLTADLSFEGRALWPIGLNRTGYAFGGWFDGCGHVISNFTISGKELEKYHYESVGLFGYLDLGAKVMRLGISDFTVEVTDSQTRFVGGLVGSMHNGTVARCYAVNGSVKGGSDAVGGLVGAAMGGSVGHSYTDVAVTGKQVGGILGSLSKSFANKYATVKACFSLGDLTGYRYVNPIVPTYENEKVTNCYFFEDQRYPQCSVENMRLAEKATREQLCSAEFLFDTLGWSKNNSWIVRENALPTLVQGMEEKK